MSAPFNRACDKCGGWTASSGDHLCGECADETGTSADMPWWPRRDAQDESERAAA